MDTAYFALKRYRWSGGFQVYRWNQTLFVNMGRWTLRIGPQAVIR